MGSCRLPGKVLANLAGKPLLGWLIERVRRSTLATGMAVVTTTDPGDDPISELCAEMGIRAVRGHPTDVLTRFSHAARDLGCEVVTRLSADSPFIDADTVDTVIRGFQSQEVDLANNLRSGWPVGSAVEVVTAQCLFHIDAIATQPHEREHVTVGIYERASSFRILEIPPPPALRAPALRLCVDDSKDLLRVRALARRLPDGANTSLAGVVAAAGGLG
jgi:spore coat polysaccharide biosynthesis protein SpsF (cytidylyltransferase family)